MAKLRNLSSGEPQGLEPLLPVPMRLLLCYKMQVGKKARETCKLILYNPDPSRQSTPSLRPIPSNQEKTNASRFKKHSRCWRPEPGVDNGEKA
jgi:hypothetical protein